MKAAILVSIWVLLAFVFHSVEKNSKKLDRNYLLLQSECNQYQRGYEGVVGEE